MMSSSQPRLLMPPPDAASFNALVAEDPMLEQQEIQSSVLC